MSQNLIETEFPRGLLRPELFLGVASSITARMVGVNLSEAGQPSGSHYSGGRYGRGEVGELVLIEGQQSILLGRITEVRLREEERRSIRKDYVGSPDLDALGLIQLLACIQMDDLRVIAGVDAYPRLGDRIYAAPHRFVALLPQLMESPDEDDHSVTLALGFVGSSPDSVVAIRPERLFGRHCAILGATGGGKSWSTARIVEECLRHEAKLILIDATGEYRNFNDPKITHCHLGSPVDVGVGSIDCSLPPTCFTESDFIALFEPAGKVQGPKLRAAIRSLRLAKLRPNLATNGYILKFNQVKKPIEDAEGEPEMAARLDDPSQPFNVKLLAVQIEQECAWPDGGTSYNKDPTKWGVVSGDYSHCLSLVGRINGVITSPAFKCVFESGAKPSLMDKISEHLVNDSKLLRICMSGVAYEYRAREIITNTIGRFLLGGARLGKMQAKPLVLMLDEAHNFIGRTLGTEDYATRLDAFELIAKEGRKYGLNICLVSQRPRDITEGVLSQMGALVVHRLTNDQDRAVIERACSEIDRAASGFLPSLRPGEAAIIGADFPIPLTIKFREPNTKPKSDGPNFQAKWRKVAQA